MTATSIGITASVFGELKWLKRKEGQIVIGAAVLDDILGIVILAVVVAVVGDGAFSFGPLIRLCLAAVAFVAVPLVALFATVFFVLIGTSMDLSVLNPFDPANREGLIVAAILLMVIGTTFLAPVLLRLVIPSEPSLGEEQAAEQPA